jgi:hypothetical protein
MSSSYASLDEHYYPVLEFCQKLDPLMELPAEFQDCKLSIEMACACDIINAMFDPDNYVESGISILRVLSMLNHVPSCGTAFWSHIRPVLPQLAECLRSVLSKFPSTQTSTEKNTPTTLNRIGRQMVDFLNANNAPSHLRTPVVNIFSRMQYAHWIFSESAPLAERTIEHEIVCALAKKPVSTYKYQLVEDGWYFEEDPEDDYTFSRSCSCDGCEWKIRKEDESIAAETTPTPPTPPTPHRNVLIGFTELKTAIESGASDSEIDQAVKLLEDGIELAETSGATKPYHRGFIQWHTSAFFECADVLKSWSNTGENPEQQRKNWKDCMSLLGFTNNMIFGEPIAVIHKDDWDEFMYSMRLREVFHL